ncbi:methylated-DNA--[protein]-cysteine S-methyltransferase [Aciduricibacillus chroicocephali]|uniref:Methylated-DNA--[protein]-cysteine S-methyltransferase n=1 Tax=Aciduricibacillus chroicocephali TaxID=3054939 RepID=A0ABY9KYK4_9BACI|nr:methylated-DNA--[protein]-cysteine S-methyltransferase [Bacillaceae bacterium 44XB]
MHVEYGEIQSPFGLMTGAMAEGKVVWLDYGHSEQHISDMKKRLGRHADITEFRKNDCAIKPLRDWVNCYFKGEETKKPPVLLIGTAFQVSVWEALLEVEYGCLKSYKEIAERIGNPKAVRAVGQAVNRNPISILVPCHCIIGTNGSLTGYNGGLDKKTYLLELEKKS